MDVTPSCHHLQDKSAKNEPFIMTDNVAPNGTTIAMQTDSHKPEDATAAGFLQASANTATVNYVNNVTGGEIIQQNSQP